MANKSRIGNHPFDAVDSLMEPKHNGNVAVLEEEPPQVKRASQAKQRITVQISLDVIERVKNAVYWTPGLTLASLAEDALATAVDKLEREKKEPFPKRREELKTGRPIS